MGHPLHTTKHRTTTVVWLLAGLLLVLPAGHHAAAGILVCFGANGHVNIEDGRYGDCGQPSSFSEQPLHAEHTPELEPAAERLGALDDCGTCLDVTLLGNPAENRVANKTGKAPVLLDLGARTPSLLLAVGALDAVAPAPPAPAPPPGLAALSSVVLLV